MQRSDDTYVELTSRAATDELEDGCVSLFSERIRHAVGSLVLETTAESIWLIDAAARTTFVNRRMASLLGYTVEEMIGRPIFDFLDRARWQLAEQNLRRRKLGIEDRQELELIRKDGTRVWVIGSANPVFDRNGEYAGALALLGDLSPQKERERLLQKQIEDLRAQLSERIRSRNPSRGAASSTETRGYDEPFRTIVVVGVLGTLLATVAVTTVGALLSAAFAKSDTRADEL